MMGRRARGRPKAKNRDGRRNGCVQLPGSVRVSKVPPSSRRLHVRVLKRALRTRPYCHIADRPGGRWERQGKEGRGQGKKRGAARGAKRQPESATAAARVNTAGSSSSRRVAAAPDETEESQPGRMCTFPTPQRFIRQGLQQRQARKPSPGPTPHAESPPGARSQNRSGKGAAAH